MSSVPQWNADIVTPEVEASAEIQANGGLEKDSAGAIGVKVDGDTVSINESGALQAAGGGGSSTVSTSGVISGDGSQASPIALNTDSTLAATGPAPVSLIATYGELTSDLMTALRQGRTLSCTFNDYYKNEDLSDLVYNGGLQFVYNNDWQNSTLVFFLHATGTAPSATPGTITCQFSLDDVDTVHSTGSVPGDWTGYAILPVLAGSSYVLGPWTSQQMSNIDVVDTSAPYTLGVARAVPSASSSDNGKVLGVTDTSGTLGWVSAGGLPSFTDNAGKTLKVDSSATAATWTAAEMGTEKNLTYYNGKYSISNLAFSKGIYMVQIIFYGYSPTTAGVSDKDLVYLTPNQSGGYAFPIWGVPCGATVPSSNFWELGYIFPLVATNSFNSMTFTLYNHTAGTDITSYIAGDNSACAIRWYKL